MLYSLVLDSKNRADLEGLLSAVLALTGKDIARKGIVFYEKTFPNIDKIDLGGTVLVDFGLPDAQVTFPVIYCNFCNNTQICYHVIAASIYLFGK